MPPSHNHEGLLAAREIRRRFSQVGLLVLSHYLESRYAMALVEELPERSGYLLKDRVSEIGSLTDALRRIADGECVIDPTIVSRLVSHRRNAGPLAQLTPRERKVLALMAERHSNHGICKQLFLSPTTLEEHVSNIFRKLDIGEAPAYHRRVLAVLTFLRAGGAPETHRVGGRLGCCSGKLSESAPARRWRACSGRPSALWIRPSRDRCETLQNRPLRYSWLNRFRRLLIRW